MRECYACMQVCVHVRVRVYGAANTVSLSLTSFLCRARAWQREEENGGERRKRENERKRGRVVERDAKMRVLAASTKCLELISNWQVTATL